LNRITATFGVNGDHIVVDESRTRPGAASGHRRSRWIQDAPGYECDMRLRAALAAIVAAALIAAAAVLAVGAAGGPHDAPLVQAIERASRSTPWTVVRRLPLEFETYHPQGLARVGDRLFLSSVEVIEAPVRYPEPVGGYDRTPGMGRGHLFELSLDGRLLRHIELDEGTIYHPGGIDYDGEWLWVPVAEYRPDSRGIVYRVDPDTLRAKEAFRVADHVGGVVRDRVSGELHGVSWGSRAFYSWTSRGRELARTPNPEHYVDFQDCAYARFSKAVCTGITEYSGPTGAKFELGGIGVVNLERGTLGAEVPVQRYSAAGHVVTRNPVELEVDGATLRMYAAPDDSDEAAGSELLVLEAPLP
jgi:hypothetical protein